MMYLVGSYPTDRMPLSHSEQEAIARLKLHLMLARLRSAVRMFLVKATNEDNDIWGQRLVEEVVSVNDIGFSQWFHTAYQDQVVQHIGYCAVYGFRITIPYLVQDMVDMSLNGYPPDITEVTLPASVNAEYMQTNDDEILSFTSKESYWWLHPDLIRSVRVDAEKTIKTHFTDFFNAVIHDVVPADSDIRRYMTAERVDVPGLAERPPNASPNDMFCSGTPHCPNCDNFVKLRESVQHTHRELLLIERRVDEALRVGIQAADNSSSRVAVFNVLGALGGKLRGWYSIPGGQSLPKWFKEKYPEHPDDDREMAEGMAGPSEQDSATSPATSIPEDFDPGSSEGDSDDPEASGHLDDDTSVISAHSDIAHDDSAIGEYEESDDEPLGEEIESD